MSKVYFFVESVTVNRLHWPDHVYSSLKKERLAAAGGNFIARSLNYQKFEPILRFALVSGQHNASANT